jgi:hypothetical protein
VLSRFTPAEKRVLDAAIDAAADAVEDWARLGPSRAANKWNSWIASVDEPTASTAATASTTDKGPADPAEANIVRTTTGWRRLLPRASRER